MQTTLIGPEDVQQSTPITNIIDAVEQAFRAYGLGTVQMPAKSYIDLPEVNGDFRSMPAYLETEEWSASGIKWVNVHPDNPENHSLPTVMGVVVYTEPETGFPKAIIDGTTLTRLRTGAAAAVATDYLAREEASSIGIIGAGVQAYAQLEAIATVRDIETVVIHDVSEQAVATFVEYFDDRFDCQFGSVADAAACDVLSTVTPVSEPIVDEEVVGEQTHINAIGADAAGKQELSTATLQDATLVIDDFEQCTHSGEINVPWSNGDLTEDDIYAELSDIVVGAKGGRTAGDEITVFDSTGLAIQDIASARTVYERVREQTEATTHPLVDTEL